MFTEFTSYKDIPANLGPVYGPKEPEKAPNQAAVYVDFPFSKGIYQMWEGSTHEILLTAVKAIDILRDSGTILSAQYCNKLCKTLLECIHVVHHHSTTTRNSKLDGLNSLSTSVIDNPFCAARRMDPESICAKCYAHAQQRCQNSLRDRNMINGIILRNIEIPKKAWRAYFCENDLSDYFRFESFGDTYNTIQARNYINLATAFPRKHFGIWTKNIGIYAQVFKETDKPKNLSMVYSCNKVNVYENEIFVKYPFVNHVFVVYDKKQAKTTEITCGGRRCMDCINKRRGCYMTKDLTVEREKVK